MRTTLFVLFMVLLYGCSKKSIVDVTSIDQIPGKWKWESTCGGVIYNCTFPTKTMSASIEFTSDGKYIEIHNDTIFLQTNYNILKYDETFGTLELKNSTISLPITIVSNRLLITRGELADTYFKLR
jgi:hypothetical protein